MTHLFNYGSRLWKRLFLEVTLIFIKRKDREKDQENVGNSSPMSMREIMKPGEIHTLMLIIITLMALCFYAVFIFPIRVACSWLVRRYNRSLMGKRERHA